MRASKTIDWSVVTLKRAVTCRDTYGVDNPSQSSVVKAQKVATSVRNYGVPHPLQCEMVKQQMRETKWAERWVRLEPSLERHGYKLLEPYSGHSIENMMTTAVSIAPVLSPALKLLIYFPYM